MLRPGIAAAQASQQSCLQRLGVAAAAKMRLPPLVRCRQGLLAQQQVRGLLKKGGLLRQLGLALASKACSALPSLARLNTAASEGGLGSLSAHLDSHPQVVCALEETATYHWRWL